MKMSNLSQTVGQKLKSLRLAEGATLKQVAKRSKLAIPTVSEMERGKCVPSLKTLSRICDTYAITLSDFFSNVTVSHEDE